ncbi:hypothetical protein ACQP1G_21520 [Nocardia sp. CA-107356]|uniref:hypothetical protein n=1 Tax=Nocardia sp. CA-107356 TaxID=3239972 RepID=UPI003D90A2BC
MTVSNTLVYQVRISAPGDFHRVWWHIRNIGSPAQVAGAFTELAARLARDLDPLTRSWCWFDCQVHRGGDCMLEQVAGPVHALDIAPELCDLARRLTEWCARTDASPHQPHEL